MGVGTLEEQVAKISWSCSGIVCLVGSVRRGGCEWVAQEAGVGPEAGEILVGVGKMPGLSYPLIAVAVAIFSTLGAVAEAAVAMSSGLLEIKKHNPEISHEDLMASGSKIGNDVLGTSMNTILFGMFGSFLSLFLWYIRLNYTLGEILNEKMFVNEILIVMYSLIAVLLTVPLSTAFLAKNMVKHEVKE